MEDSHLWCFYRSPLPSSLKSIFLKRNAKEGTEFETPAPRAVTARPRPCPEPVGPGACVSTRQPSPTHVPRAPVAKAGEGVCPGNRAASGSVKSQHRCRDAGGRDCVAGRRQYCAVARMGLAP